MILNNEPSYLKFKYKITDILQDLTSRTYYLARQRTGEKGSKVEVQSIDEDDKAPVTRYIKDVPAKLIQRIMFLCKEIDKPLSIDEAGTESEGAILIKLNKKDSMADNVEVVIDQHFETAITQHALHEWCKSNGMYDDSQVALIEYTKAVEDLVSASRQRKKMPRRSGSMFG